MVTVKPGYSASIDFTIDDILKVEGIASGIVVATKEWSRAGAAYVLPHTDVPKFVEGLAREVSPQAKIYLIGGQRGISDEQLTQLKSELTLAGLHITEEDTLSEPGVSRNMEMDATGKITVEYYRMRKTPVGMTKDTLLIKYLPSD